LQVLGGTALTVAPFGFVRRLAAQPARGRRVVVLGGGFAGCTVAGELRRLAPEVETVVVEPAADLFLASASLDVVFGRRPFAKAVVGYDPLTAQGIRIVKGEAKAADLGNRSIETTAGTFSYDALVLATGIRLAPEEIKGLATDPSANATFYDRDGVVELTKRIASFDGGIVVVNVPPGALKCPPAPYEFALLMAARMKANKLKGRIVLIDAWPTPQPGPISEPLLQALSAHGDLIDYVSQAEVRSVDAGARKATTASGEEFEYDLLSLIPPNRTARLVVDLKLAEENDVYAAVDPVTLRSTRDAHVFAIGDVARTPFGKSAAAATSMARNCAREIARMFGVKGLPEITAERPAQVVAVCYPHVEPEQALKLQVTYSVSGAGSTFRYDPATVLDAAAKTANVAERLAWEKSLVDGIFAR
jgi:sulfide dehydrogenase [flavocytochrome c] flavoprotein chain